jgi:hypothetical protein
VTGREAQRVIQLNLNFGEDISSPPAGVADKAEQRREQKRAQKRKRYAENLEKERARRRERHAKNREKRNADNREWRARNREQLREKSRKRYAENLEKERERSRRRFLENIEKERERSRKRFLENRVKQKERLRHIRETSPETFRAYGRAYYRRKRADPEKWAAQLEYDRRRRAEDPERSRAAVRRWSNANPGKMRAYRLKRIFRREQRTPTWVDMQEINRIYHACPDGMHVDHIVPFLGITTEGYKVSGLHVPWNLQYLSAFENISKSNKMRPEDGITAPLP